MYRTPDGTHTQWLHPLMLKVPLLAFMSLPTARSQAQFCIALPLLSGLLEIFGGAAVGECRLNVLDFVDFIFGYYEECIIGIDDD